MNKFTYTVDNTFENKQLANDWVKYLKRETSKNNKINSKVYTSYIPLVCEYIIYKKDGVYYIDVTCYPKKGKN